jgi:hypothetical protein
MNKKFFLAWLVLLIAWFLASFLVHGVLLRGDYLQLAQLFRTDADQQQYFPYMVLAHVLLSGAFVWIYARGVEARPWFGQGVRFALAIALLTVVPSYLIYYAVQPMPGAVVAKQILFDTVVLLILGTLVAWLYRATPARA